MKHILSLKYFVPLTLLLALQLIASPLYAQRIIRGTVTSFDHGETLPGVNVVVKGTTRGVSTDIEGRFQIEVLPDDLVLVFSFIGFEDQEIAIGNRTEINVELHAIATQLDELVVIGYGTVRKSDLTGAVSSLRPEDLRKLTVLHPEKALQGKAAGVQITTVSGAPGTGAAVRIRGVGTFNDSAPIFVVDGVIVNDISFLNSADIATMEVLKDASATAIYGSRGANGVVLITTFLGRPGQELPLISFSTEFGIQQLTNKIDLLSGREFAIISNEIRPGSFNNVDAVPNVDWQELVFQSAPMHNHQFSIAGSTPKTQYYVGLGLFMQEGIVPKSDFQRITLRINNTYNLSERIRLGNNISIAPFRQQIAPGVTWQAYRAQPVLEPFYADGSFGAIVNVGNPLADLEHSNNFRQGLRGVGNLFGEFEPLDGLTFRSSFGVDAAYNKIESFTPAFAILNPDGTASQQFNQFSDLTKGNSESMMWLWENTATFERRFGKHFINAVGGYTMQQTRSEELRLAGQNILRDDPSFWYIDPAYIIDEANNINMLHSIFNAVDPNMYYNMISYLFRANYSFDNRFIGTVTFRRDGSSKFSKENRFSNFPSFAAGWNIHNERFMQQFPLFNSLRIRASWGIIGNEKILYHDRFARVQSDLLAVFAANDIPFPAASYFKNANPDLRWESTTQTDIGLEVGMLNNRLTGEFGYYNRITDDILIELSTPGHMGNGMGQRVRYNAAEVLNRGFEFNIRWRESIGDFSYSIGAVGTTIHNEVLSIGGATGVDSVLIGGFLANGQPVTLSRVGLPIGAFYGYQTDGIFQTQDELNAYPHMPLAGVGDLRFVDTNGDGRINGLDRTFIGSSIPKFIYGFNFDVQYKAFDLSVDFQGQTGNKIFNGKDAVRPDPYNFERSVWNRWRGPDTSNDEPRPDFGGYNYTPSDRFIQDGSYLRLRNVVVGYTLPEQLARRMAMQSIRLYVKGTNLFTLTEFTGYTPEIGSHDVLSNGIDYGIYPIPAFYAIGLNVTF